ncbi:unnamed protein product [Heterobilharzia americana]|nr:unnamed protein product [Heterobilharzia americana]
MSLALQCEGQSRDFAEPRSPEFVTNMGGTNSHPGVNSNQTQLKTYKGFECYNDRQVISKESFRNKFNPCFYELAGLLWDYFSYDNHNSDNCLSIKEYENIIDCLSSSQEKLTIFINLFKRHTLSELDIRALFKWFTLGRNLQSGTWQLILNSILPSNKDGLYKCDEVISCLNRKCQDVCNDLVTILLQCLNDNQSFDLVDFNPYTHFGTILTPDLLWLLSTCLTYPYKRAPKTCLLLTKTIRMCTCLFFTEGSYLLIFCIFQEQLSHLHCLYNSTSHGMSLTRLLELTFDYNGPVIVLLKAKEFLFCLLSDQGLKESLKPFGGDNSFLYQIEPTFSRLVYNLVGD